MLKGYSSDFIGNGIKVEMPKFSPKLEGAVYQDMQSRNLHEGIFLNYVNYSIVMNSTTKQLVFAASNINQNKHVRIDRDESKAWETDSRIPDEYQLDNRFYKKNDWDRGHMVQRNNNCWGNDYRAALKANDDTFFYTNAAFQHKFFNQDEWLKLENYIGNWMKDSNGKLCIFTGPIHFPFDRLYARTWHDTVRIPSAFFKIVCYHSQATNRLETRAFMLYQDREFIGNKKKGAQYIKLKNYQVSITELEDLTGLEFDEAIVLSNPLYYSKEQNDGAIVVNNYPERIPIDNEDDIVKDINTKRKTQEAKEEEKKIIIAAAMVNPEGSPQYEKEWISILNISDKRIDIDGWYLQDHLNRKIELKGRVLQGKAKKIFLGDYGTIKLPNTGGTIILKNSDNEVVDRQIYLRADAKINNKAIRF